VTKRPTYAEFLRAKAQLATGSGFDEESRRGEPAPQGLQPRHRALGAARRRRAIFAAFGLHKTCMQLEIMRLLGTRRPGPRLIVAPLGVRQEFKRDAGDSSPTITR
jgi:hypothetical protein